MSENRLRERHELGHHGYCYYCSDPNTKVPFAFEITDVSYRGMGIHTNQDLLTESILYFRFSHNNVLKELKVQVKWVKHNGYLYASGVEFIEVVKEDIVFLHALIKHL